MKDVIGFVGLGRMGRPMASNLVRKGFNVLAFDLIETAIADVVAAGARAAASAAEAAAHSDVLFTMLPNSSHVQSVIGADVLPNLKPGGIVVDMSTIDPSVTDTVARSLGQAGFGFVDAPVGRSACTPTAAKCCLWLEPNSITWRQSDPCWMQWEQL